MHRITELCQYIERNSAEPLPLRDLSRQAGLSPFHLQRVFKAATGLTPKQFQDSCRARTFRANLRQGGSVTEAIYAAGYGSNSRAYERTPLGMTPTQYQKGGEGQQIRYATFASRFGPVLVAATARGVCAVRFGADALKELRAEFPKAALEEGLREWIDSVRAFIEGISATIDVPLDIRATDFQLRVWDYLRTIPRGETRSYAGVAAGIGQPTASRAVANACAANPVAMLIPCHRVVRGDGEPGGYRWGNGRKRRILEEERLT
ncbi:MAG: methylated-DNA--[protein]-cysteine S-methyltransferase [Candidatus Solibacter usitatus]|nr:methylated-DNA--[protein]-cysteine S-methyltransferase [Candidatus Solibacter usitatus]